MARYGMALIPFAAAIALFSGCAQPRVDEAPDLGTLSDNPLPTDSVYGTPPDPIPTLPPPPATASPTGREPRLIWTSARQATWNRMVQENHPRFQMVQRKCDRLRAGNPAYGDRGLWCTLIYQWTGDVSAARAAWGVAGPLMSNPPAGANDARENFIENAIMFDWLYPALTDAERTQAMAGLRQWANYVLSIGTAQYEGGMRTGDSDALVGYYLGLAAADLATQGMAGHVDVLNSTQTGWAGTLPVGGLYATGVNRATARNTLKQYITVVANGGQWIESSDYDMGTVTLLTMGIEAVRTAAGSTDPFPEIDQFYREAMAFNAQVVTSDLLNAFQWGDDEHPREFVGRLYKRVNILGLMSGASPGSYEAGRAMDLIDALVQRYGAEGYGAAEPWARFYLLYDPYAPRAAWNPDGAHFASGMGQLVVRSGADLFSATMANRTGVDHEVRYLADFQLYRNGEWAITKPVGYDGPAIQAEATNGLLLAGLSAMQTRGASRVDQGNDWYAITGSTSGAYYASDYYQPPPAFVSNWQRTTLYLKRNGIDHVVTVDWIDMQDPRSLPLFTRYRAADLDRINASPALVEWILHAPVTPQASGGRWSWSTGGGQQVTVTPVGYTPAGRIVDESVLWAGDTHIAASERKYQLRLAPAFTGGTTVLRNVITVGEANPTITSSGNTITIDGVQVTITPTGVQVIG